MSEQLRFKSFESRNVSDWTVEVDPETGRATINANGKGILRRCSLVMHRLTRNQHSIQELYAFLRRSTPTITKGDIRVALRKLKAAGIIQVDSVFQWSLTPKGERIWKDAEKAFI